LNAKRKKVRPKDTLRGGNPNKSREQKQGGGGMIAFFERWGSRRKKTVRRGGGAVKKTPEAGDSGKRGTNERHQ